MAARGPEGRSRRSARDRAPPIRLVTRIVARIVVPPAVLPVVLSVVAVFVSFVHHGVQPLEPTLDILTFARVELAITGAVVDLPLTNIAELRHEIARLAACIGPVAHPMLDALDIMLIELFEALIAAEILAILALVVMAVILRERGSGGSSDGRGREKNA